VQGSFEHFHVLLPTYCKWVKHGSNSLCVEEEERFKGTTTVISLGQLDYYSLQLYQVPLCAISSSFYSCYWVLAATTTCASPCGEREDDATILV
jgi:hypothetical protein